MSKYKLYKITVEKEFIVAAPEEDSLQTVENTVNSIMRIHADSMRSEAPTHVVAEELHDLGNLPKEWDGNCLPYTNHHPATMPRELINTSIQEIFDGTY